MVRVGGQLPLSTIGVIFVLVFAGMYGAVQFAKGDLVPENSASIPEQEVEDALWTKIENWYAEQERLPANNVERVRVEAQETAELIASRGMTDEVIAAGPTSNNRGALPNAHSKCEQLAARVAVPSPGYDRAQSKTVSMQISNDIAASGLTKFRRVDTAGVLLRPPHTMAGIGVAIEDDRAYVVYRSCLPRRMSP